MKSMTRYNVLVTNPNRQAEIITSEKEIMLFEGVIGSNTPKQLVTSMLKSTFLRI
jgi:hypothetical protein